MTDSWQIRLARRNSWLDYDTLRGCCANFDAHLISRSVRPTWSKWAPCSSSEIFSCALLTQRPSSPEATLKRSFWPRRNATTRRAGIGISSRVLGLRPGRRFLSRRSKLPKPENFTGSSYSSYSRIVSKKRSMNSLASRLLRPSSSNRASINSALVSVTTVPPTPSQQGFKPVPHRPCSNA